MDIFDKKKLLPKTFEANCVDITFPFTHSSEICDKLYCLGMYYLDSAKTLLNAENKFYAKDYYILPVLHLLNHGIELSIKYYLMKFDNQIIEQHDIIDLFKKIKNKIKKIITEKEFNAIPWDNTLNIITVLYKEILNEKNNLPYRYPINSRCELYEYADEKNRLYINQEYLTVIINKLIIFFDKLSNYIDEIIE